MPAPLFAIPTTAGTGSEVTIAAVVSDPSSHIKTPLMDPKLVPLMAALDANLMIGLPPKITADT
ncbi:iron-containing alcohol dehydrogenase, partial [Escherichia coli]|nr:iron-containing alcohol dehydrogenase [Escherichia coli]